MEAFNNLLFMKIVFLLLHSASYVHADCVTTTYKTLPSGLNLVPKGTGVFERRKEKYIFGCVQWCAGEFFCRMWTYGDGYCQIFHSLEDKVEVVNSSTTTTYYETDHDDKWTKIYYVKSGREFNVKNSFLGSGTYGSWGPSACTRRLCSDLFRSPLIDVWGKLPITKVKVSLRKKNNDYLSLVFDGWKSTEADWFSMSRVLSSPWTDVHKTARYDLFTVYTNPTRKFYMSLSETGCSSEAGWLYLTDSTTPGCQRETRLKTYPQILYSEKSTATVWYNDYGLAEDLSVYITLD